MSSSHFLPRGARGVWLVVTEHASRVFMDLDEGLFQRIPAVRADGSVSQSSWDGRWTRLGLGPHGETSQEPVQVGHRALYGIGFSDHWITSRVVEIRPATDDEVPPPNGPLWEEREWPSLVVTAWCGADVDVRGEGDTCEEALRDLARQIDAWLDGVWKRRETTRTARGWAARCDRSGSVLPWVLKHAVEWRPPR